MNFKFDYGFQHGPKVITFGLNKLVIVNTISYGQKSKLVTKSDLFGLILAVFEFLLE